MPHTGQGCCCSECYERSLLTERAAMISRFPVRHHGHHGAEGLLPQPCGECSASHLVCNAACQAWQLPNEAHSTSCVSVTQLHWPLAVCLFGGTPHRMPLMLLASDCDCIFVGSSCQDKMVCSANSFWGRFWVFCDWYTKLQPKNPYLRACLRAGRADLRRPLRQLQVYRHHILVRHRAVQRGLQPV